MLTHYEYLVQDEKLKQEEEDLCFYLETEIMFCTVEDCESEKLRVREKIFEV
jgi:hypothetical protein